MHSHVSPQMACLKGCKVVLVAFVLISPLCVFKCVLKWPAREEAKSHWLHLFDFSLLCDFMCLLKWHAWEDAKSHWFNHICLTFPHCSFSCVSSNCLPKSKRMQSHIGCVCLNFLHCALSCVSSNNLPLRMQSHIGCICFTIQLKEHAWIQFSSIFHT